jgi:DNA-binding GntR family transcriptional regulator
MYNQIEPIENCNKTISAMVRDRIRQAITLGILPSGSRIDQARLAEDLDVSIVPVREALKLLEGEGFVQIIPRRGAFVTETSPDDMQELYDARAIIEGEAAYHAAPRLTDEHIARLEGLYGCMDAALKNRDSAEFKRNNRAFHFTIYDAAGNNHLSSIIAGLWDLAERYRFRHLMFEAQAASLQAEHRAMLAACRSHDAEGLRSALVEHLQQTFTVLKEHVAAQSQRDRAEIIPG